MNFVVPVLPRKHPETAKTSWLGGLLCLVTTGFMCIAPSVVTGQESDSGVNFDPSQSWAYNWIGNWRQRVINRHNRIDRLLSWKLSDSTMATFYGQLNVLYRDYDDGIDPFTAIVNNPNSPGRFGLNIESDLQNGVGLTIDIETGLRRSDYDALLNRGNAANSSSEWNRTLLRKAEIRLSVPKVGFLSFGQGSMAGDGITGFDFSKTVNVASSSVSDSASGSPTYFSNGAATQSALQSFFPTFDASRRFRFRFDMASRGGLSWSASAGREVLVEGNSNTYADVALRYETKWRRFGIKGGVAYAYNDASPDFFSGSVAGKDDNTGLNFAAAAGSNMQGARYGYLKIGMIRRVFRAGDTAFSFDHYAGHEPQALASASSSTGIGITQHIDAFNVQVFATYRRYDITGAVNSIQGSDVVAAGFRVTW
ncbi:MAG: hypothetical protein V2I51_12795 [Anderseniella sp.]|jgi:hypothetical protein|nr:hypothetical protein [Anderseniella sp.]